MCRMLRTAQNPSASRTSSKPIAFQIENGRPFFRPEIASSLVPTSRVIPLYWWLLGLHHAGDQVSYQRSSGLAGGVLARSLFGGPLTFHRFRLVT